MSARPGAYDLAAQPGESIYETSDRCGPHKPIAVTVNRAESAHSAPTPTTRNSC